MSSSVDYQEKKITAPSDAHLIDLEPLSLDEIIDRALNACVDLPLSCKKYVANIEELRTRLARGKLHLAVLGQFNRGKSTFINALIGLKVLPTSVLPLTSVPTIISWGRQVRCTIRFFNGNPDLVVQNSLSDITETLSAYVAEERNPENQLCVREAEVNCPADLLENGTVLIDTPGFGSTFLHNTRTALDTLVDCDAALFLISADPPLTQMEVEFLKQIQNHVSRVFFILNKIDLLSDNELKTVDRFVRETLTRRMGYTADMRLFHVCAAKGLRAHTQLPIDKEWNESGMESVRSGILDFMIREKYFALAQALTEKFTDAIDGICNVLQREIEEHLKPMETMNKEHGEFSNVGKSVRKSTERESALIDVEKKAVLKFVDELVSPELKSLEATLLTTLGSLLAHKAGVIKSVENLTAALNKILFQSLSVFRVTAISRINKPFRKAVQMHLRELMRIRELVNESVGDCSEDTFQSAQDKLEALEVDAEESWGFPVVISTKDIITEWSDWFLNRQTRVARVRNRLEILSKKMLSENVEACCKDLKNRFSSAFEGMHLVLNESYTSLIQGIDKAVSKKEQALNQRRNTSEKPVKKLKDQIVVIKKVKSFLK